MNKTLRKIFSELCAYKFKLFMVVSAVGLTSFSMLSFGYVFRRLVDNGISKGDLVAIKESIMYLGIVVLMLGIGIFARAYYTHQISHLIVSDIRIRIYKSVMQRSIGYFDSIKTSDYLSRFTNDINYIGDTINNLLSFSLRNTIMSIGGMVLMFTVNIKLSLITLGTLPLTMILVKIVGKRIKYLTQKTHQEKSSIEEIISETLGNIKIIYSMNIKDYRLSKLLSKNSFYNEIVEKYLKTRSLFFSISIALITLITLLVIWIGGIDVATNNISSGNMVSFIFYALLTAFSIGGVADVFGDIQKFLTGAERIYELETIEEQTKDQSYNIKTPFNIELNIKDFAYPARPDTKVISDIHIEAKAGEFIGIAGPSGSGKSTMLQILMGIYKAGSLTINSEKVDLSLDSKLRTKIAYITQDPFLFSSTIEENIKLGRKNGNLDKIIDICGLKDMISKLPKGIKTYVGEKGAQLSGGQKQRIAIARALYGNPEALLMDEATSALDNKSENAILKKLKADMKGKIIISIAHRLSSIIDADKIMVIHNGEVISVGTHKELLKKCKLYAGIVDVKL